MIYGESSYLIKDVTLLSMPNEYAEKNWGYLISLDFRFRPLQKFGGEFSMTGIDPKRTHRKRSRSILDACERFRSQYAKCYGLLSQTLR